MSDARKFGPKTADHPSVGENCYACKKPFVEGDYTTLIALGPGDDEESRKKCASGGVIIGSTVVACIWMIWSTLAMLIGRV